MPTNRQRNDLLRSLIRQWAGTEPATRSWSRAEVDLMWPALMAQHAEVPLGAFLPSSALTEAQRETIAVSRGRTACLLLELERILPIVRGAGCEPVVLKGAALALTAYSEPTDRWFVDLDLLVPLDTVEAVCERLLGAGYRPFHGRASWAYYDQHHVHRILIGPAGSVVEVHWALTAPASSYHYDPPGARDRARTATIGRETCLVAAPADQVVQAVYQHLANGFVDLRRVLDLVRLGPRMTSADWQDTAAVAAAAELDRALEFWLHIMKQIVGIQLPDLPPPGRPLGSLAWRMLGNLDVANGCLERRAARIPAYDQFLHQVLLPSHAKRLRDLRRMALSSGSYGIQAGHAAQSTPAWPHRLRQGLPKLGQMAKMALVALGAPFVDSSHHEV